VHTRSIKGKAQAEQLRADSSCGTQLVRHRGPGHDLMLAGEHAWQVLHHYMLSQV
jgi:hypothetical protein